MESEYMIGFNDKILLWQGAPLVKMQRRETTPLKQMPAPRDCVARRNATGRHEGVALPPGHRQSDDGAAAVRAGECAVLHSPLPQLHKVSFISPEDLKGRQKALIKRAEQCTFCANICAQLPIYFRRSSSVAFHKEAKGVFGCCNSSPAICLSL
eukprot:6176527-Pleurochrysis_carterae.AAC.2